MASALAPGPLAGTPEHHLVREVLHCCQGIGGKHVWFQDDAAGGRFAVGPGAAVPPAQQALISRLAELGWLARTVRELCAEAEGSGSVVHEALAAGAQREMSSFYRLVAVLEAQAARPAGDDGPLTLRRLAVWLSEPTARLRVVAACLHAARGARGGRALSAVLALAAHGDPLVRGVAAPLADGAAAPYFRRLLRWVLDGALDDAAAAPGGGDAADGGGDGAPPGGDFMIVRQQLATDHPAALWRAGWVLDEEMRPACVPPALAAAALTAGKTVAFLREVAAGGEGGAAAGAAADWAALVDPVAARLAGAPLPCGSVAWLEAAVADVAAATSGRLLAAVVGPSAGALPAHLAALRRYLLLAQGDFARALLDAAAPELDKPARDVSQYALQGCLEAALRTVGALAGGEGAAAAAAAAAAGAPAAAAGAPPDCAALVTVRLARGGAGDLGWDVFGLGYALGGGPAAAVLGPDAMAAYARASRLLWAVKRAEHGLAAAWAALDGAGRSLARLRDAERRHGLDAGPGAAAAPRLLRLCHAKRAEAAQFVAALQAHFVYEVLAPAFGRLDAALPAAADLDGAIAAHEAALADISRGLFLEGGAPAAPGGAALGGAAAADVHSALRAALRAALDVLGPARRLAAALDGAAAEARAYLERAAASEAGGEWSDAVLRSPEGVPAEPLEEVRAGVWRCAAAFDRHVRVFVALLPPQSALDLSYFLEGVGAAEPGGELRRTASAASQQ